MTRGSKHKRAAIDSALDRFAMMRRGQFDLSWMRANPRGWGTHARPSEVGVTLADIIVGPYAEPPDRVRSGAGVAPRGAEPLSSSAVTPYDICEKAQVWADNVAELYEEGASRHWSSARDIPWGKLTELDDDLEHAVCQLCTQLAQMEIIALEFPARWIPRVSREFHEVKILLAMH